MWSPEESVPELPPLDCESVVPVGTGAWETVQRGEGKRGSVNALQYWACASVHTHSRPFRSSCSKGTDALDDDQGTGRNGKDDFLWMSGIYMHMVQHEIIEHQPAVQRGRCGCQQPRVSLDRFIASSVLPESLDRFGRTSQGFPTSEHSSLMTHSSTDLSPLPS